MQLDGSVNYSIALPMKCGSWQQVQTINECPDEI